MRLQHLLPHQLQHAIDEQWPLLVPTGCIEYHGPHLPLGVDTIITEHLLMQVAERVNCVVAPPIWYGPASHAVSGPELGSLDVSTERFGRYVKDIWPGSGTWAGTGSSLGSTTRVWMDPSRWPSAKPLPKSPSSVPTPNEAMPGREKLPSMPLTMSLDASRYGLRCYPQPLNKVWKWPTTPDSTKPP